MKRIWLFTSIVLFSLITINVNVIRVHANGGTDPEIKALWETTLNDGWTDDDQVAYGTQVNPELLGDKYVYYWIVVTDTPLSDIDVVYADVKHPDGSAKYQVSLTYVQDEASALAYWEAVYTNNPTLISYGHDSTYSDIYDELNQGRARIYYGGEKLSYCQPAGEYIVEAIAIDQGGLSGYIQNQFWYVPTVGVDYDFTQIDYNRDDPVYLGAWNQLDGDLNFGTPWNPTVRVTGNVPVYFDVTQDDMGFNKTDDITWNVKYKARLGGGINQWTNEYMPYETVDIPGHLPLCTTEKLDFQIYPIELWLGSTQYQGIITFLVNQYGSPPYYPPDYNPDGWEP